MHKKFIAAIGALSLVGGLATNLISAPKAQAYTEESSCIVRADLTICALTTDYGLFDPGSLQGYAVNNLFTVDPKFININGGQYIYRDFYADGDSGQGTGAGAYSAPPQVLTMPLPEAVNFYAAVVQSRSNNQSCDNKADTDNDGDPDVDINDDGEVNQFDMAPYCGQLDVEFANARLQQPGGPGIDVVVAHVYANPKGNGDNDDVEQFRIAVSQLDNSQQEPIVVFDFVEGGSCSAFLGPIGQIGICNNRPALGQILVDNGLGALAPVIAPLPPLYTENGELIKGSNLIIPSQPFPFLPVVPFLILP